MILHEIPCDMNGDDNLVISKSVDPKFDLIFLEGLTEDGCSTQIALGRKKIHELISILNNLLSEMDP